MEVTLRFIKETEVCLGIAECSHGNVAEEDFKAQRHSAFR